MFESGHNLHQWFGSLLLVLLTAVALSCSDDQPSKPGDNCADLETQECTCDDGTPGLQTCQNGRFGACECGGMNEDVGVDDASTDMGSDTGSVDLSGCGEAGAVVGCASPTAELVCRPDGTTFEATCTLGTSCRTNRCEALACAPEERRCNDNAVEVCAADGLGFDVETSCAPTEMCDEATLSCSERCVLGGCPSNAICNS